MAGADNRIRTLEQTLSGKDAELKNAYAALKEKERRIQELYEQIHKLSLLEEHNAKKNSLAPQIPGLGALGKKAPISTSKELDAQNLAQSFARELDQVNRRLRAAQDELSAKDMQILMLRDRLEQTVGESRAIEGQMEDLRRQLVKESGVFQGKEAEWIADRDRMRTQLKEAEERIANAIRIEREAQELREANVLLREQVKDDLLQKAEERAEERRSSEANIPMTPLRVESREIARPEKDQLLQRAYFASLQVKDDERVGGPSKAGSPRAVARGDSSVVPPEFELVRLKSEYESVSRIARVMQAKADASDAVTLGLQAQLEKVRQELEEKVGKGKDGVAKGGEGLSRAEPADVEVVAHIQALEMKVRASDSARVEAEAKVRKLKTEVESAGTATRILREQLEERTNENRALGERLEELRQRRDGDAHGRPTGEDRGHAAIASGDVLEDGAGQEEPPVHGSLQNGSRNSDEVVTLRKEAATAKERCRELEDKVDKVKSDGESTVRMMRVRVQENERVNAAMAAQVEQLKQDLLEQGRVYEEKIKEFRDAAQAKEEELTRVRGRVMDLERELLERGEVAVERSGEGAAEAEAAREEAIVLRAAMEMREARINELEREAARLSEEAMGYAEATNRVSELEGQLKEARDVVEQERATRGAMENELRLLRDSQSEGTARAAGLEEELRMLKDVMEMREGRIDELESEVARLSEDAMGFTEATSRAGELQGQLKEARAHAEAGTRQVNELNDQLKESRVLLEEAEAEKHRLEAEVGTVRAKLVELESQVEVRRAGFEPARQGSFGRDEAEIERLKAEVGKLRATIAEQQASHDELAMALVAAEKGQKVLAEEKAALVQVRAELQQKGERLTQDLDRISAASLEESRKLEAEGSVLKAELAEVQQRLAQAGVLFTWFQELQSSILQYIHSDGGIKTFGETFEEQSAGVTRAIGSIEHHRRQLHEAYESIRKQWGEYYDRYDSLQEEQKVLERQVQQLQKSVLSSTATLAVQARVKQQRSSVGVSASTDAQTATTSIPPEVLQHHDYLVQYLSNLAHYFTSIPHSQLMSTPSILITPPRSRPDSPVDPSLSTPSNPNPPHADEYEYDRDSVRGRARARHGPHSPLSLPTDVVPSDTPRDLPSNRQPRPNPNLGFGYSHTSASTGTWAGRDAAQAEDDASRAIVAIQRGLVKLVKAFNSTCRDVGDLEASLDRALLDQDLLVRQVEQKVDHYLNTTVSKRRNSLLNALEHLSGEAAQVNAASSALLLNTSALIIPSTHSPTQPHADSVPETPPRTSPISVPPPERLLSIERKLRALSPTLQTEELRRQLDEALTRIHELEGELRNNNRHDGAAPPGAKAVYTNPPDGFQLSQSDGAHNHPHTSTTSTSGAYVDTALNSNGSNHAGSLIAPPNPASTSTPLPQSEPTTPSQKQDIFRIESHDPFFAAQATQDFSTPPSMTQTQALPHGQPSSAGVLFDDLFSFSPGQVKLAAPDLSLPSSLDLGQSLDPGPAMNGDAWGHVSQSPDDPFASFDGTDGIKITRTASMVVVPVRQDQPQPMSLLDDFDFMGLSDQGPSQPVQQPQQGVFAAANNFDLLSWGDDLPSGPAQAHFTITSTASEAFKSIDL